MLSQLSSKLSQTKLVTDLEECGLRTGFLEESEHSWNKKTCLVGCVNMVASKNFLL